VAYYWEDLWTWRRREGEDVVGKGPLTTWWNARWYSPNVLFR
jgi:hypothetical protein